MVANSESNPVPNGPDKENLIHFPAEKEITINKGIGEYLYDSIHLYKDRIAQIDSVTGKTETYDSLLKRAISQAKWFRSLGLTKEDVLSMCCYNNMEYSATVLAAYFAGVPISPMDPSSPLSDIEHCLKLTSPRFIFCEQEHADMIRAAIAKTKISAEAVIYDDSENSFNLWKKANNDASEDDTFEVTKIEDVFSTACILFSSGTTGFPKGVCVTHYALFYNPSIADSNFEKPKVLMTCSSPYWISNMTTLIWSCLYGIARVIYKYFDETNIMKVFHDYEVEMTILTPLNINKLLQNPQYCNYETPKLKVLFVGGSASDARLILDSMNLFPNSSIFNGYGMTEMGGLVLLMAESTQKDLLSGKKTSIGGPVQGFMYKIVDDNERCVGPNEHGEIRIKFRGVMNGYYKQPDVYAAAFDEDGFLKTGDIVFYDENYKFFYVDRLKEIFKYQGWHISPVYIEAELLAHPNVKQAAVVGVPSSGEGELPTACVALIDENESTTQDIIDYIAEKLPDRYHLRGGCFIVKSIPVTSTGKLRRKDLRQIVMELKNQKKV